MQAVWTEFRRLTTILTVAGAAGALLASPATAQDERHPLGMVEFNRQPEIYDDGGRWLRVLLEWHYIEPTDDQFNWQSGFEFWLQEAESVGLEVSPVIAIGKCWATGHAGEEATWPSYPPLDLTVTWDATFGYSESYYDYVKNLIIRYGDRISRISVENEVNTREFWRGTLDDYRRLLATARKAVDDWGPHLLLFDSGLGSGSWGAPVGQWMLEHPGYTDDEILEFVNEYYANNVYAQFYWNDLQEFRHWVRQPFVQENNARVEYILSIAGDYCDGLNLKYTEYAYLLPTVVAWMDELLAAEGTPLPLKVNNEASNWPLGSQALEAQNMFKMVITSLSEGVEQTLWFPYSNADTSTPRRGLIDENGDDTIQAATYLTLSRQISSIYQYVSKDVISGDVLRYRFQRDGETEPKLDAVWWDNGSHGGGSRTITIPVPAGTMRVAHVRYDGASELLDIVDGTVTVTVTEGGHFLRYLDTVTDTEESPPATVLALTHRPNPFRPQTTIEFSVPEGHAGDVTVAVFDAAGRLVVELARDAFAGGSHSVVWDGRDAGGHVVAAGTYFTRVATSESVITETVTRLR